MAFIPTHAHMHAHGNFDFVQNGGPVCAKILRKITKLMKNWEKTAAILHKIKIPKIKNQKSS